MERIAVIDMGSNSWRLVVYASEPGTVWWSLSDEIREPVRIGAGMSKKGELRADRVERALHTAAVFDSFCRASGIDRVVTVATSAIRDASNGERLLSSIRESTDLDPRVISGEEEARYGYLAICNSTTLTDGFGIDIGGGSIQVMCMTGRALTKTTSLPLGTVRVSEEFLPGEKAPAKAMRTLRKHAAGALAEIGWWSGGGRLVGIGGTIRNLAAAAVRQLGLPAIDVQGHTLTREALAELIEQLAAKPASKRGSVGGIKPDRGDVILGGALVLMAALEEGGFEGVEVSEAGLREGVFLERLLSDRDPPLLEDVRRAAVENLAHRFRSDDAHVKHVATLSLEIFDGLRRAGLHDHGDAERELLWAACLLHDIGTAIDYDDHHRHSHYLVLNAGLPGFSPRELVLVGLTARYHRKGDPSIAELGALTQRDDADRLRLLSGVIRLAEQLERSRDQTIAAVRVEPVDGAVSLHAETRLGADASVPIWAARGNAGLLGQALGRTVDVVEVA